MKIGILRIGQVASNVGDRLRENLNTILVGSRSTVIGEEIPSPKEAFSDERNQYRSDIILREVSNYARKINAYDRVLGIVNVDVFVPRLNFVFGEAECPGKGALISLWRLRPEFYGRPPDRQLFIKRSVKEAVHELGHTLGLAHCSDRFCVMHFSNSIFETDIKQNFFCDKCSIRAKAVVIGLGKNIEGQV